jgi:hypothetical protein
MVMLQTLILRPSLRPLTGKGHLDNLVRLCGPRLPLPYCFPSQDESTMTSASKLSVFCLDPQYRLAKLTSIFLPLNVDMWCGGMGVRTSI